MAHATLLRALLLSAGGLAITTVEPACSSDSSCVFPNANHTPLALLQVHQLLHASKTVQPHVCILARICGPESPCKPSPGDPKMIVEAFAASISAQTYESWELHLLNGEGGGEVYREVVTSLGDARITNGPSSPTAFATNTWGYEATNKALSELLLPGKPQVPCEYFLFTNADNLYGRHFLETGQPGMVEGKDLLGFNFVTRYVQAPELKPNLPMHDVGFTFGHVDLGSVLVSAKAVEASNARFDFSQGIGQDWKFFENIIQRPGSTGTVFYGELQYIHQLQYNASLSRRVSVSPGA